MNERGGGNKIYFWLIYVDFKLYIKQTNFMLKNHNNSNVHFNKNDSNNKKIQNEFQNFGKKI